MFSSTVRVLLDSLMIIIGNLVVVAVNERTRGFATARHRFIGLAYDLLIVVLTPLFTASNFTLDSFWMFLLILSMADFGNSRELSLRWMLHGAAQTGPLRWLQAFSRHLHHHCAAITGVILLHHREDKAYQDTTFRLLYFQFCSRSCQIIIRMRFKRLARVLSVMIGVLALGCIFVLWFHDSQGPLAVRAPSMAAFVGTLINVVLTWSGPYVKSKSTITADIRGRDRRRSCGGVAYEVSLTPTNLYESMGRLGDAIVVVEDLRQKVDVDDERAETCSEGKQDVAPTMLGIAPKEEATIKSDQPKEMAPDCM